jgi:hypothetical protein
MAEIRTRRAGINEMAGVAERLDTDFGTGPDGALLRLGRWSWDLASDGQGALPALPALTQKATPREQRDHRFAEGLRLTLPATLFKAFMTGRRAIERATTYRAELMTDGYTAAVLVRKLQAEGALILPDLATATKDGMKAEGRVAEVRRALAEQQFADEAEDAGFLAALDLQGTGAPEPGEKPPMKREEATRALTQAVYDVAVVQALTPLTQVERALVMEGRALPDRLADARVLAAVFRSPSVLVPLKTDERQAVAKLAFALYWPLTHKVAAQLDEAVHVVREVLGQAVLCTGGLLAGKPLDAFRQIPHPGGAWLLEPMASYDRATAQVLAELNA